MEMVEYKLCPKKKAHWDHFFAISPRRIPDAMFIYQIGPIDYWAAFQRFDEYVRRFDSFHPDEGFAYDELIRLDLALRLARDFGGWEGDISAGPYAYPDLDIAGYNTPDVNIVWKQDNNGTTFICSSKMSDYLENKCVCTLIDKEIKVWGPEYEFGDYLKKGP